MDLIKSLIWSKNRVKLNFPHTKKADYLSYFGDSGISDVLSFGYSYIEQNDHYVGYLVASPFVIREIIKEIDEVELVADKEYIGVLWTARLIMSDRVDDYTIIFSNPDKSVILELNLNKME